MGTQRGDEIVKKVRGKRFLFRLFSSIMKARGDFDEFVNNGGMVNVFISYDWIARLNRRDHLWD